MSPFYAVVLMWTLLFATLIRAWWMGRLCNRDARSGWIQMVLATLVLSLQGEAMELAVDQRFNGLPVTLYIKHFSLVIWFWLYLKIMVTAFPDKHAYPLFFGLIFTALAAGIITAPIVAAVPYGERSTVRELMVGLRDVLLIAPVVFSFIPGTFALAQRERVRGAQSKLLALLIGYSAYIAIAVTNIFNAVILLINHDSMLPVNSLLAPVLLVSLLALIALYLPYHLLTALWYPHRLLAYWKLRQLEKHVMKRVGAAVESRRWWELLRSEELELAIYRTTINVLDYGALLQRNQQDVALYQKIQQIAERNVSYPELVQQLTTVRV